MNECSGGEEFEMGFILPATSSCHVVPKPLALVLLTQGFPIPTQSVNLDDICPSSIPHCFQYGAIRGLNGHVFQVTHELTIYY